MTPEKPKVSVSIVTYNHAEYVSRALDGVLMQETGFDYEILVGEDDSSDGTREIVKDYAARYPERIRLFLNDRENVIYINGRPTGRWNLLNNLRHVRGDYIALLDGDDYWTSPHKLQKQADFLESQTSFAICFHNVDVVYSDDRKDSHAFYVEAPNAPFMQGLPKPVSTFDDILRGNFIQTPSVMFRNGLIQNFPNWFYKLDRADWPLYLLLAQHGHIHYMNEALAVYRVHPGGIYSSMSRVQQLLGTIQVWDEINRHFAYQYDNQISKYAAAQLILVIKTLYSDNDFPQLLSNILKYFKRYGLKYNITKKALNKLLLRVRRAFWNR